ncbi:MAG: hypothetical protein DMF85_12775, partial [Acidobacteria bacterium]
LEARGELGGRATAFADRTTGERVDNGQHVLLGCYRETFTLLRRIGAEGHVRIQPTLEVPYLDAAGRRSVLRCPPLPSPLHLLAGVMRWDALPWRERLSVLRLARPLLRARAAITGRAPYSGICRRDRVRVADVSRPARPPARMVVVAPGRRRIEPVAVRSGRGAVRSRARRDVRARPDGRVARDAARAPARDVRPPGAPLRRVARRRGPASRARARARRGRRGRRD